MKKWQIIAPIGFAAAAAAAIIACRKPQTGDGAKPAASAGTPLRLSS